MLESNMYNCNKNEQIKLFTYYKEQLVPMFIFFSDVPQVYLDLQYIKKKKKFSLCKIENERKSLDPFSISTTFPA